MSREYWDIKEEFKILFVMSEQINTLCEIMNTYPNTRDMPLEEVENWLSNRYAEKNIKLEGDLKFDNI